MLLSLVVLCAAAFGSTHGHGPIPSDADIIKQEAENHGFHKRCPRQVYAKPRYEGTLPVDPRQVVFGDEGFHSPAGGHDDASAVLLAPQLTQGPFHLRGEIFRQDITESQPGLPLLLLIDFIDMSTCLPVPDIYVDVWQSNATGYYSAYTGLEPEFGCFGFDPETLEPPAVPPSVTFPPPPEGEGPYVAADPEDATWADWPPTDPSNFLRGIWKTDASGRLTMRTIVPGHYPCRTPHIHIKAITEGELMSNGTVVAVHTVHTGQIFFDEGFTRAIQNVPPYSSNTFYRTNNTRDLLYSYATSGGYHAELEITYLDSHNISKGVVGKIAVGLNMSFSSPEVTSQFYRGEGRAV